MRAALLVTSLSVAALAAACSSVEDAYPSADVKQDPQACASCHLSDYEQVRHPPHAGVKPTTCAICHTQDDWHPSVMNHPWPLTGAHAKEDICGECHHGEPAVFRGTPRACYACHAAEYQKAPDHVALAYPTTCEECHSTSAWKPTLRGAERLPRPKTPEKSDEKTPETNETPGVATSAPTTKKNPPKPKLPRVTPTATSTSTGSPTTKPPDVTTGSSRRGR